MILIHEMQLNSITTIKITFLYNRHKSNFISQLNQSSFYQDIVTFSILISLKLSLTFKSNYWQSTICKTLYKIIIYNKIDDIAFEPFAMHCGIGWGIRQKKIPQEK